MERAVESTSMVSPRPELQILVQYELERAVRARDASSYGRAIQGLAPVELTVCLGPGRCMFPKEGSLERICPFCMVYPTGIASSTKACSREVARRFTQGN